MQPTPPDAPTASPERTYDIGAATCPACRALDGEPLPPGFGTVGRVAMGHRLYHTADGPVAACAGAAYAQAVAGGAPQRPVHATGQKVVLYLDPLALQTLDAHPAPTRSEAARAILHAHAARPPRPVFHTAAEA